MAVVQTLIGNVKGPQGDTGATGATGAQGDAATIEVGSVTTAAYGTAASVTNSGTTSEAVLDFVIPQGAPGDTVTDMQNLTLGSITSSSASFPTPTVGETGKVIFGKINKWFSDMAALVATKFNTANVVNNLTTTDSGYALDARQGKVLADEIKVTTGTLTYGAINFFFTQSSRILACTITASAQTTVTPNIWTTLGDVPSGISTAFGFLSIPMINGAMMTLRYNGQSQKMEFYCTTGSAFWGQGSGATRF